MRVSGSLTRARRKALGAGLMVLVPLVVGVFAAGTAARPGLVPAVVPADGAVLATAPAEVVLDLQGGAVPREFHLGVTSVSGMPVTCAEPTRDGGAVKVPVCISRPGTYQVAYHVAWADGRDVIGSAVFTVGPEGAAVPDPGVAMGGHAHGDDPLTIVLTVLALLSISALAVLMFSRPRLRKSARHES